MKSFMKRGLELLQDVCGVPHLLASCRYRFVTPGLLKSQERNS